MLLILIGIFILLLIIIIGFFGYKYYNKLHSNNTNECLDTNQCIDINNQCIDIPPNYIKNDNKFCVLDCSDENMCIQNGNCVIIPQGHSKDIDNDVCRKVSFDALPNTSNQSETPTTPTPTPTITPITTPITSTEIVSTIPENVSTTIEQFQIPFISFYENNNFLY